MPFLYLYIYISHSQTVRTTMEVSSGSHVAKMIRIMNLVEVRMILLGDEVGLLQETHH